MVAGAPHRNHTHWRHPPTLGTTSTGIPSSHPTGAAPSPPGPRHSSSGRRPGVTTAPGSHHRRQTHASACAPLTTFQWLTNQHSIPPPSTRVTSRPLLLLTHRRLFPFPFPFLHQPFPVIINACLGTQWLPIRVPTRRREAQCLRRLCPRTQWTGQRSSTSTASCRPPRRSSTASAKTLPSPAEPRAVTTAKAPPSQPLRISRCPCRHRCRRTANRLRRQPHRPSRRPRASRLCMTLSSTRTTSIRPRALRRHLFLRPPNSKPSASSTSMFAPAQRASLRASHHRAAKTTNSPSPFAHTS